MRTLNSIPRESIKKISAVKSQDGDEGSEATEAEPDENGKLVAMLSAKLDALTASIANAKPPQVSVYPTAPDIEVKAPAVTVNATPPCAWSFEITARDSTGRIKRITATPVQH